MGIAFQRDTSSIRDLLTPDRLPLLTQEGSGVLVTLVHTEGSCYQKAGAQLFLSRHYRVYGLISGGCLENTILEKAAQVLEGQRPECQYVDTGDPSDLDFGFGLGCGGKLWIFYEPIGSTDELRSRILGLSPRPHLEVITIEANDPQEVGRRWVIDPLSEEPHDKDLRLLFGNELAELAKVKSSALFYRTMEHRYLTLACFARASTPQLSIFGAGPGSWPLAHMARLMGWTVKVLDHREAYIHDFPKSVANPVLWDPANAAPFAVRPGAPNVAVVATHSFHADCKILTKLLDGAWQYIGILGSQRRTRILLQRVLDETPRLRHAPTLAHLYAPAGLNLGGTDPQSIALSIVSEIQALCYPSNRDLKTPTPYEFAHDAYLS